MCINKEPCDQCKKYMKQGILLISIRDNINKENPYRTGAITVIKEKAAKRIFNVDILKSRAAFIEDSVWDKIGLPR